MFVYSKYWGSWSRVLSTRHPKGPYVEVNLTPIAGWHSSSWETDVVPIRIRFHGTRYEKGEICKTLLEEVKEIMIVNLGEDLTNRLLTEDFLSQIDIDLYEKHNNGGANLADISKEGGR